MTNINIDTTLFPSDKIININATNLFDAFTKLSSYNKTIINQILSTYKQKSNFQSYLEKAKTALRTLLDLRNTQVSKIFTTTDNVNHLENYLEAFCGYCQGAKISLDEGALLQLEFFGGCQSLAIQKHDSHDILGFHTEEDSDAYDKFGSSSYGKYWVEMTLPNSKFSFLHYVELCGYGYSYSIATISNQTSFNISDVLGTTADGNLWSHIINFALINCQNDNYRQELITNLQNLPSPKFSGGYTSTIIECSNPPTMIQVEFGGDTITTTPPSTTTNFSFHSGINYPHDPNIQSIDIANSEPTLPKSYLDRFARLAASASEIANSSSPTFESIQASLRNPQGEWRGDWFTGYSNIYVANHILFHITPEGDLTLKLISGNPQ